MLSGLRAALCVSLILALTVSVGGATAHPLPVGAANCPCIALGGTGSKSATFDAAAAFDIYQNDIQPSGDPSELSGWTVQNASGRIVAARIYVAKGTVFSHSIGESYKVRLPRGRYVLTRLSKSAHRFLIPVRGLSARKVEPRARPSVIPTYTVRSDTTPASGMKVLDGSMSLPETAKLLFVEVAQARSSRLQVLHCLDQQCASHSRAPSEDYPYASSVVVATSLDGDQRGSRFAAVGVGEEMWTLQLVLSTR
jgi:hypothetical protein